MRFGELLRELLLGERRGLLLELHVLDLLPRRLELLLDCEPRLLGFLAAMRRASPARHGRRPAPLPLRRAAASWRCSACSTGVQSTACCSLVSCVNSACCCCVVASSDSRRRSSSASRSRARDSANPASWAARSAVRSRSRPRSLATSASLRACRAASRFASSSCSRDCRSAISRPIASRCSALVVRLAVGVGPVLRELRAALSPPPPLPA